MKNEIKVGLIVLLALFSMFISVFFVKDIQFEGTGQKYIVRFKFLNSLITGGRVMLYGGIRVGTVQRFEHDGKKANVYIVITDSTTNKMIQAQKVRFTIQGAGLLGEKYLLIEFDNKNGKNFSYQRDEGGKLLGPPTIDGIEGANFESIITKVNGLLSNQLTDILTSLSGYLNNEKIPMIIDNLAGASQNLNKLIENSNLLISDMKNQHVSKIVGQLSSTLSSTNEEIQAISKSVQSLLSKAGHNVDNLFDPRSGIIAVTREGTSVLRNVNSLVSAINKIVKELDQVVKNMNDEDTPIGALLKDKKVAKDLKKTLKNLSELTGELKDSPLLSDKNKYRPGPF